MFAIWANICWLSCCSLGSMAWLLHQSVWWLGFPCMQMHVVFISSFLFSPAMAESTLCSDVSSNAWCPFIALLSSALLFFWRIASLLIVLLRTSPTIISSSNIFWRIFSFNVREWSRQEGFVSLFFFFFLNYVDLSMYHPQSTFMSAPKIFLPSSVSPPSFSVSLEAFPPYYLSAPSFTFLIA